ncbi:hypothetical protein EJ08DRAFT_662180 [Tothia fuscella]|uniref:Uncharacterized protein n=1 Tax=Tothia fuscella TaxID=1048955 RepID=A0A9P4NPA8_9PEZI|nr:hypothetical protein EJ08DRAFT_662180 [Tothia fuscella]
MPYQQFETLLLRSVLPLILVYVLLRDIALLTICFSLLIQIVTPILKSHDLGLRAVCSEKKENKKSSPPVVASIDLENTYDKRNRFRWTSQLRIMQSESRLSYTKKYNSVGTELIETMLKRRKDQELHKRVETELTNETKRLGSLLEQAQTECAQLIKYHADDKSRIHK